MSLARFGFAHGSHKPGDSRAGVQEQVDRGTLRTDMDLCEVRKVSAILIDSSAEFLRRRRSWYNMIIVDSLVVELIGFRSTRRFFLSTSISNAVRFFLQETYQRLLLLQLQCEDTILGSRAVSRALGDTLGIMNTFVFSVVGIECSRNLAEG